MLTVFDVIAEQCHAIPSLDRQNARRCALAARVRAAVTDQQHVR